MTSSWNFQIGLTSNFSLSDATFALFSQKLAVFNFISAGYVSINNFSLNCGYSNILVRGYWHTCSYVSTSCVILTLLVCLWGLLNWLSIFKHGTPEWNNKMNFFICMNDVICLWCLYVYLPLIKFWICFMFTFELERITFSLAYLLGFISKYLIT